jgi:hypothetical protein
VDSFEDPGNMLGTETTFIVKDGNGKVVKEYSAVIFVWWAKLRAHVYVWTHNG